MADKYKTAPAIAEFPVHGLNFFNEKIERELKKAITTYESIKQDLNLKKFTGINFDTLLNATSLIDENDRVEKKFLEESGLSVPQSDI